MNITRHAVVLVVVAALALASVCVTRMTLPPRKAACRTLREQRNGVAFAAQERETFTLRGDDEPFPSIRSQDGLEQPPAAVVPPIVEKQETAAVFEPDSPPDHSGGGGATEQHLRAKARAILTDSARRRDEIRSLREMPLGGLTEEDRILLAQVVESEALSRSARMAERYGLNDYQHARVFEIFAESAAVWNPDLEIETSVPAAADPVGVAASDANSIQDRLYAVLDEEQQDLFVDDLLDLDLWWAEIIDKLEEALDSDLTATDEYASDAGAEEEPTDGEAPDPHPGGNVFDLLGL